MLKLVLPITLVFALAATVAAGALPPRRPPTLGIAASPTLLYMQGAGRDRIEVSNIAKTAVTVTVGTGNYAISGTGHVKVDPKVAPNRAAKAWLTVAPRRFRLAGGASTYVSVAAHPPRRAEPGDHNALVYLATSSKKGEVGVQTRLGVGVLVRMPGQIQRRLVLRKASVVHKAKARYVRVVVGNSGNINERVAKGRLTVTLMRGSQQVKILHGSFFELLPKMRVRAAIRYRGKLHGRFTALVRLRPESPGNSGPRAPLLPPLERSFTIRL
jgi:hypothetical protein